MVLVDDQKTNRFYPVDFLGGRFGQSAIFFRHRQAAPACQLGKPTGNLREGLGECRAAL
jgi:hypothetical protein